MPGKMMLQLYNLLHGILRNDRDLGFWRYFTLCPMPTSFSNSQGRLCYPFTEWAPSVYFEDDTAVNLEEQLARSRRIKCSLCGVKGAALGCYENGCGKSFHVPCARKFRECRWDSDHFVILCPLHISSKLPCQMSISQVKKGRSNLNGAFSV
ncbi:hypothetical protein RND81_05G020500 [Saponaria officinalis]|uniref:PHD-type domain-containing protein n=1 Tax=Saponaria officinalis TaxID=3572 RepID=A0AAW1KSY0_SAPOF